MKKISYNAPLTLTFSLSSVMVLLLNSYTSGLSNHNYFSVYRSNIIDPAFFLRLFGHVLGHANWEHLMGNILLILVLGPMLEEKHGTKELFIMVMWTALITGLVNLLLFPHILLGASGVVFMMIVLSSFSNNGRKSDIPLTMILVLILYIGREIVASWVMADNISRITHVTGGVVGVWFGFKSQ